MKRLALFSVLLLMPLVAAAQEATLFNDGVNHGGYGGLFTKITPMNGSAALMLGAEATWLIDDQAYVGVQAQGLINEVDANTMQSNGQPYLLWVNEAGLRGGYIHHSEDLVHFSAGAFLGIGSLQLADRYFWWDPAKVETLGDEEYYFVAEPEVAAELNVTKWMRTKVAGSYRIVAGADANGMTSGDLGGPAGSITLMFGSF